MEAVREPVSENTHDKGTKLSPPIESVGIGHKEFTRYCSEKNNPSGRNLRDVWTVPENIWEAFLQWYQEQNIKDVWTINPQAYPDAHYATFPEKLVEPCIKVATSQKGVCPKCGSQWARVVKSKRVARDELDPSDERYRPNRYEGKYQKIKGNMGEDAGYKSTTTLGWRPTCGCVVKEPVPAIVYDPFMGSGTVAAVAARLGRNYIGSELNESYIKEQADYRVAEAETGISKAEQLSGQKGLFEL